MDDGAARALVAVLGARSVAPADPPMEVPAGVQCVSQCSSRHVGGVAIAGMALAH
jgi:hypothetical protein